MSRARLGLAAFAVVAALGAFWCLRPQPDAVGTSSEPQVERPSLFTPIAEIDAGVGEVAGTVMWSDGLPAAGVSVSLFAERPLLLALECRDCGSLVIDCSSRLTIAALKERAEAGAFPPPVAVATTQTDAEGHFRFAQAPRSGVVRARVDGSSDWGIADEEVELSLRHEPTLLSIIDRETALPLTNARVSVYSAFDPSPRVFISDEQGQVSVPAASDAWALVERADYLAAGASTGESREVSLVTPKTLTVRVMLGAEPIDADVVLEDHGQQIHRRAEHGVARFEGLHEGPFDLVAHWKELSSVRVELSRIEGSEERELQLRTMGRVLVTVTDAAGQPIPSVAGSLRQDIDELDVNAENGALLVFEHVPAGEHELRIQADHFVADSQRIEVSAAEQRIEVMLQHSAAVEGVVVDSAGNPVPVSSVTIDSGDEQLSFQTDEEGHFVAELPLPGPIRIHAWEMEKGTVERELNAPDVAIRLVLEPRGSIRVTVRNVDGTPAAGSLTLESPEGEHVEEVLLSIDGETPGGFLAGVSPGPYRLRGAFPGAVPVERDIRVEDGQTTHVKFQLERGLAISGRVLAADGGLLPTQGFVRNDEGATVDVDPEGHFEFSGFDARPVRLTAFSSSGAESEEIELTPPVTGLVLKMRPPQMVNGRVVNREGQPIAKFTIDDQEMNSVDGRFSLPIAQPSFLVQAAGFRSVQMGVDAMKGDIVLVRDAPIRGVVVDQDGRPLEGATVWTSTTGGLYVTDGRGRFALSAELPCVLTATLGARWGSGDCDEAREATLRLSPATRVHGRVIFGPEPVHPTRVSLWSNGDVRSGEASIDGQGHFEASLRPDTWTFSVVGRGTQHVVEVRGSDQDVVLDLTGDP